MKHTSSHWKRIGWFGIAAMGTAAAVELSCGGVPPSVVVDEATNQDVILIVIDTLRGDAAERARTPELDWLANNGGHSIHAWAPGTWTAPSTLSLMTGSHLRDHGWDLPFPDKLEPGQVYPSLDDRKTLAEVMKEAGYTTMGLYANPLLSRELGWQRGFDSWKRTSDVKMPRKLRNQLKKIDPEAPLFAYLHYLGPHQPLYPSRRSGDYWGVDWDLLGRYRKGLRRKFIKNGSQHEKDQYYRAYHAQVEDADRRLGWIWPELGERFEDALIIVTSDHGEMLGEHGVFGHGSHVWDPVTRVPLVVHGSKLTLPSPMSTTGVADLITRSVGIDYAWPETIHSAWPLVSQREGKLAVSGDGFVRGVWRRPDRTKLDVYDLATDPNETTPVNGLAERAATRMIRHLWQAGHVGRQIDPEEGEMDDETKRLLEELGYMGVDDEVLPPGEVAAPPVDDINDH